MDSKILDIVFDTVQKQLKKPLNIPSLYTYVRKSNKVLLSENENNLAKATSVRKRTVGSLQLSWSLIYVMSGERRKFFQEILVLRHVIWKPKIKSPTFKSNSWKFSFECFKIWKKLSYNHVHNILRLFDVWANFLFTKSERRCDY